MIVVVGAEKGGVGKSSIAVNIATIALSRGVDALLLDTDSTGSASLWCSIRSDERIQPEVHVLTLTANVLGTLHHLAARHELIVIDVGARSYQTLLEASLAADLVLVPTSPGQFEASSTLRLFEAFRGLDVRHARGRIPAHVLLTMLPTNARSKEEDELRSFMVEAGLPVMSACLRFRKAWREASKTGRAIHELGRSGRDEKAAAEILALYEEAERLVGGTDQ